MSTKDLTTMYVSIYEDNAGALILAELIPPKVYSSDQILLYQNSEVWWVNSETWNQGAQDWDCETVWIYVYKWFAKGDFGVPESKDNRMVIVLDPVYIWEEVLMCVVYLDLKCLTSA